LATDALAKAEQERHERTVAYLDQLSQAYPAQREKLTEAIGTARGDLEAAVAGDGANVFSLYLAWTRRVADLHAFEVEIAEIRNRLGQSSRYPSDVHFSWQHDLGAIVDGLAMAGVDTALREAQDRRAAFISGGSQ